MLKAVLDTNILASAWYRPSDRDAEIWDAARRGSFQLLTSPDLVRELGRIMRRRFSWSEADWQRSLRAIARTADLIVPQTRLDVCTADPDDNRVLECALDGRADVIVSNDRHLLALKSFRHIPIVVSPDFRRTVGIR